MPVKDCIKDGKFAGVYFEPDFEFDKEEVGSITFIFYDKKKMKKFNKKATKWLEKGIK